MNEYVQPLEYEANRGGIVVDRSDPSRVSISRHGLPRGFKSRTFVLLVLLSPFVLMALPIFAIASAMLGRLPDARLTVLMAVCFIVEASIFAVAVMRNRKRAWRLDLTRNGELLSCWTSRTGQVRTVQVVRRGGVRKVQVYGRGRSNRHFRQA